MNLINGDCLLEMSKIKDNSHQITLTSPPYNMNLRIRNGKYCSRQIVKELSTKYINFDDNLPMDEYFEFNKSVITESLRIAPLCFYNMQILTGNKPAFFQLLGHFSTQIKELIIWNKVNAQPAMCEGVLNSQFEVIIVLDRDDAISRKFNQAQFKRGELSNLWDIKRTKSVSKSHGAVFPEKLVLKILENFTAENDSILDPFMGTGTTGAVCKMNNRNFTGIEINEDYFDVSRNRIESILL